MKNVVLISIDCLRADYAGYTEDAKLKPPCITYLAENGYAYENCIVQAPFTTTSHASMLSGLYPFEHGIRHLRGEQLSSDVRMIQHDLKARGYVTYGFVSCYHMSHIGLHHGFDEYRFDPNVINDDKGRKVYTIAEEVTNRAIKKLAENKRTFLFLHYFDAHVHVGYEYEPLYYDAIMRVDEQIRRIVNYCGEDTLFIITADHGRKMSGEHNYPYLQPRNPEFNPLPCTYTKSKVGNGAELYDEIMRVPLIVYNGNGYNVKEIDCQSVIQSIDIGNIIRSELDGVCYGRNREYAYMETFSPDQLFEEAIPLIGLRTNDWKLICYQTKISGNNRTFVPAELYNLKDDPKEKRNIIGDNRALARRLAENLAGILKPRKRTRYSAEPIEDEEYKRTITDRLRAMGYI